MDSGVGVNPRWDAPQPDYQEILRQRKYVIRLIDSMLSSILSEVDLS